MARIPSGHERPEVSTATDQGLWGRSGAIQGAGDSPRGGLDNRDHPVIGHPRGTDHPQHAEHLAVRAVGSGDQRTLAERLEAALLEPEEDLVETQLLSKGDVKAVPA